jgi:hypothetical protein
MNHTEPNGVGDGDYVENDPLSTRSPINETGDYTDNDPFVDGSADTPGEYEDNDPLVEPDRMADLEEGEYTDSELPESATEPKD